MTKAITEETMTTWKPGTEVVVTLGGTTLQATVIASDDSDTVVAWIVDREVVQHMLSAAVADVAVKPLNVTATPVPAEYDAVEAERQRYHDECAAVGVDPVKHEDAVLGSIDGDKVQVGEVVWRQMNHIFDDEPVTDPAYYQYLRSRLREDHEDGWILPNAEPNE